MIITEKESPQATKKCHEEPQFGKQISLGTAWSSRMWRCNYKSWGIWDPVKEFIRVTRERVVKQDMFRAVLEVCILTYLQLCECKFVIIFLFCNFFHFLLAVNMSLSGVDTQDFHPALRPKRKRGPLHTSDGASSSFVSPNQFPVLSDS
jgi:hypothetical protein